MNRKDIITLPHENLRKRSKRIGYIDATIRQTCQSMVEATLDWEEHRKHEVGVALAAVQIDQLLRIIIIRNDIEDKNNRKFLCFINPVITKRAGEPVVDFEGCLSVKNLYGKVPRYPKVKVKAMDLDGKEIRVTAEGFLARIFQHEIDHLNGILFIDHLKEQDALYKIDADGKLTKLDYEEIVKNRNLWN